MTFLYEFSRISQVMGTFAAIGANHVGIRADVADVENAPILWGCPCRCNFDIRDVDALSLSFTSRVERFYNSPNRAMHIILELPRAVEMCQRRFSRRVTLTEEEAAPFGVWRGILRGSDPDDLPRFEWEPIENTTFRLAGISASGCRLISPRENATHLNMEDNILLRGDFGSKTSKAVYILSNVVRMGRGRDDDEVVVGCHFRSWSRAGAPQHTWFRTNDEGLGFVGEWVSRRLFKSMHG